MKKKAMAAFLTLGLLTCAAGTNAWGQESIPRMRDYVWPEGLKVLRLEDGNYNHQMTVLDYELFNVTEILPRLWGGISLQSRDNDGDGYAESLQYTSEDWGGCAIKDTNGDGYVDYAIVIEMPQPGEFGNFQMEWTDNDENGTLDTIQIKYNAMIDGDEYAITGLWGDCRVLNQEYSEFDYDNEGRIRYIQLVTVNTENDLGEQQFVLVNSNEIHSIDCPDPNETIVLQIPVEAIDEYRREEPYISFGIRGEAQNRRLTALVRNMYQVYEARAYGYELKVKSLFYELLYLLVTEFRDENMDAGMIRQKQNLDRLSQVTRYMKEHYQEDLRLEEVASRFGFSATYLSRIFHKYAQVNYRTYLIDLRVKYAVRQLLNTDLEIEQIAIAHGFPDSRSFSKAFQKRYGCLPSRYRKQMKP